MRIVRYAAQDEIKYGILKEDTVLGLKGSPFQPEQGRGVFELDDSESHLKDVRLLAPCLPSKLVCLGVNYRSHAEETGLPIPPLPLIFLKPSTAVIGPEENIVLPALPKRRVDYEAELAIVIGRVAKQVQESETRDYVLGYTCFNDVSERYAQRDDVQWTRSKSYDTFAPIGPWIETEVTPDDLGIESYLNGELRQSSRTSDLIFGIDRLVSHISGIMTLLTGDVIATGTPSGIGRMNPGDTIEIKIEGIGTLRNYVLDHSQGARF